MHEDTPQITELLVEAGRQAREEVPTDTETLVARKETWPVEATIGPGLEGAIACYTEIGHVNGAHGQLTYRGYNIFDLAAHSTFEETTYLLLFGKLPTARQLKQFQSRLVAYRHLPDTLRLLQTFPVEECTPMEGLRLAVYLLRRILTVPGGGPASREPSTTIGADEDSIPEETQPMGFEHAVYEMVDGRAATLDDVYHLISGMATLTAAIARIRTGHLPIEPDPELGHAANLLYMMTGRHPTPEQARIMDVCLILHADHGMNASTFAAMVVASTLSDIYFSIGAGVAALNGPLHGGANEQVLYTLEEVLASGDPVAWYKKARRQKRKIMGFGHRVYKTYDPRARLLGPLAEHLAKQQPEIRPMIKVARALEHEVVASLGADKGVFPNVDFFSGLVYRALGIDTPMFTPLFAVSRVSGWAARCLEYLRSNRIFRPRALYTGTFDEPYVPLAQRSTEARKRTRSAGRKSRKQGR